MRPSAPCLTRIRISPPSSERPRDSGRSYRCTRAFPFQMLQTWSSSAGCP
jgi:hypothetical protein